MKVVLVVGSISKSFTETVEKALRIADARRREGCIVFAPCLDKRHSITAQDVQEIHQLEMMAIKRRFPDEVYFTDVKAQDVREIVEEARLGGYGDFLEVLKPAA